MQLHVNDGSVGSSSSSPRINSGGESGGVGVSCSCGLRGERCICSRLDLIQPLLGSEEGAGIGVVGHQHLLQTLDDGSVEAEASAIDDAHALVQGIVGVQDV